MTSDNPHHEEDTPETDAWAALGLTWRAQQDEPEPRIDVAAIARRSKRFAWRIALRNAGEWAAAIGLVAWAGREAWLSVGLARVVHASMALAAAWVGVFLVLRGRNLPAPPPAATTWEVLAYERAQLARQRKLLAGVRAWYLLPLFLPLALSIAVDAVGGRASPALIAVRCAIVSVVFIGVDRLNARAEKKLAERLARLGE